MTDIVERLRKMRDDDWKYEVIVDNPSGSFDLFMECLTEIETLRAENTNLRKSVARYAGEAVPNPIVGNLVKSSEMWGGEVGQVMRAEGNFAYVKWDDQPDVICCGISTLAVVGHVSGKGLT